MIVEYALLLLVGRVVVFFVQTFPLASLPLVGGLFQDGKFLYKLVDCDLCLGFWVYLLLAYLLGYNMLTPFVETPHLREILTAMLSSLTAHLLRVGWDAKFGIIMVRD